MIAKGTTHDNGGRLATYLIAGKAGERAELWQLRGFASDDIKDAFRSVHVMAEATRCEKPLFHVQVRNPAGEHLTRDQWDRVADRIESKLGLTDQPRAIAFHRDAATGDEHMHIGWSRIDGDTMTAKALPFFKLRLKEVSRELETELGLTPVRNEREGPVMAPRRDEDEQARRLGVDIRDIRARIRECWERSDNGHSFAAALSDEGLMLAKGERRDFIAIDHEGGLHALGKRILGNSASEVRARTADIDREQLPTIEQARQQVAARREASPEQTISHADKVATRDVIAEAANENTARKVAEPEAPIPPMPASPKRELDEATVEIRSAYRTAATAADFTAALARTGIRLAAVTVAEAESSGVYRGGEIVAVTQTGQAKKLDELTTGVSRTEVEKFLASIDRGELHGIEATQEQIHLEVCRHIDLSQVGALSERQPDTPQPDWRQMLNDYTYCRQIDQQDRERQAQEKNRENLGRRSRGLERF
jgi:hypothetical protein